MAGQQISVEDALEAFRKRHGEVADENVLLRFHATRLEQRVAELERENAELRQAPIAADDGGRYEPVPGGPDLAAL